MAGKSYEEIAFQVMRPFVGDTFTDAEFTDIIAKAYANLAIRAAPMVQLDNNHFLLELFHGPTLAFKDFAMQLIGQLFQVALTVVGIVSPSWAQPVATQAAPRLRRFAGWMRWMCSSFTHTGACQRYSAAK